MKLNIKFSIMILAFLALALGSCNKSEDLVTSDAKTGGLVTPTKSVPYKLGNTPVVNLSLFVPQGPAISKVNVYNVYSNDTVSSNKVLMKTVDINGGNSAANVTKDFTINYSDLTKGLSFLGGSLPSDEGLLPIGNKWTLSYEAVMSDSRVVVNKATTNIAVANLYAGSYQCVGVFHHPTAGDRPINQVKFLVPKSAYTCNIPVGDLGASGYAVDITVDPATNDVSYSNGTPAAIIASATRSYYEPSTGKFYLHYFYVGSTGNRVIDEEYTPIK